MDIIDEIWLPIPDFPLYVVSNLGNVMNVKSDKLLKLQQNPAGITYVSMYENKQSQTRSVKLLVARAFVDGETRVFDTPINKDGNKGNNRVDNIVWRPLWFATKYSRQFLDTYAHSSDGPVYDVDTDEEYSSVEEAGITFGLLFRSVYASTISGHPVFPTDQRFRLPSSIHVR